MSTTSIKSGFAVLPPDSHEAGGYSVNGAGAVHGGRSLFEALSLAGWRRQALEIFVFLAVIAISQRSLFGVGEIPGLPHPYWLPVLLASCQYGVRGGMIATVAASALYFFGLSPQSAAQDFYTYAGMVAIQPAAWLATALVLGGLRDLHIHQYAELAEQFAASRRRAGDLSDGLDQATGEINALERRIALDMTSVAAFARSLSLLDMSDRRAAAASFGELFRVGAGTGTMTVYLRDREEYVPIFAVEDNSPCATKTMDSLSSAALQSMLSESARPAIANDIAGADAGVRRHAFIVRSADAEPLAAIVCELQASQDLRQFNRRADELGRAFATILHACGDAPAEAHS